MSEQRIFAFWTGDNIMPDIRKRCLDSFGVTGLEPTLVTRETLPQWIVPGQPLHPAYEFLSPVHRSDYLRAYFMYHYGEGYADIKQQTGSWLPTVQRVNDSRFLIGAGYREIRGNSAWLQQSRVDGKVYILSKSVPTFLAVIMTAIMRTLRPLMIGNGALYFKPKTAYARLWLSETERRLDRFLPTLRNHPAQVVRDRLGYPSGYPIPWTFVLADITQPLMTLFFPVISRSLPCPLLTDYDDSQAEASDISGA